MRCLGKAAEYKDNETGAHVVRMNHYSRIVALALGLTEQEWEIVRQHTVIGAQILGDHPSGLLRLAATIALCHYEKWDGSGYPRGLAGEDIPLEARIVAIADVFDALNSVRPYKRVWSVDDAVELIRSESGGHFDQRVVEAFLESLPELLQIKECRQDAPATETLLRA